MGWNLIYVITSISALHRRAWGISAGSHTAAAHGNLGASQAQVPGPTEHMYSVPRSHFLKYNVFYKSPNTNSFVGSYWKMKLSLRGMMGEIKIRTDVISLFLTLKKS